MFSVFALFLIALDWGFASSQAGLVLETDIVKDSFPGVSDSGS